MSDTDAATEPHGTHIPAARQVAYEALKHVLNKRQPLDLFLERSDAFYALSPRDKAFVRMLTATALRRLGQIDHCLLRATEKDALPHPPPVLQLLRLGTAQILFMNVPDYAVVDTTVVMAAEMKHARQKGLINAVLRRIAREGADWVQQQDPGRMNTPPWLLRAWIEDYGLRAAAETAQANLTEAPLDISLKDAGQRDYWAETLKASVLPTGTLRRHEGGLVTDLPGFEDGMWWVQDAAAALPARLLGDVAGKHVIDMCAAPGGKTAQLAAAGADVTAIDRSSTRMKRLKENLHRLRLESRVKTEVADAASWTPPEKADYILLDAPCTSTGTLRRHPDIAHLKDESDVRNLTDVQDNLLHHAVDCLAPGGMLVYCTCSLQKAEGEHRIARLLQSGAPVKRAPVKAQETGGIEGILTPEGDVRTLPFHLAARGGIDGFFISRLVKI